MEEENEKVILGSENHLAVVRQLELQQEAYDNLLRQNAKDKLFIFNKFVLGVEQGKEELCLFHKDLCNFVTDDVHKKKLVLIPRGHLKALRTEGTNILTPTGFKKYKELRVGDKVIGGDGLPTRVVKIHPKSKMELYKVTTNDGRTIICNRQHLFRIRISQNSKRWQIKNLDYILSRYSKERLDKRDSSVHYEHPVQLEPIAVEYSEKKLPVDPYTLGMWLGDGHSDGARMTTADPEIFNYSSYSWHKLNSKYSYGTNGLQKILRLEGLKKNKHIPKAYLLSSREQRLELLRGLMDTDGTPHKQGGISYFSNTNYRLIEDVVGLVRSLGGVARVCKVNMKVNNIPYDTWTVSVKIKDNPFKLKRKAKQFKGLKRELTINIVDVRRIEDDIANCITVENPDGMFITDDYFPTHNSTLITIGYCVQQIVKNPNIRILILNATWQMAVDFLSEIKRHLTSNEELRRLYPEIVDMVEKNTEWAQDRITLRRDKTNIKGPTVWAAGVDSNLTGSHPDLIIFDDVQSRDNSSTREQIEKVILRYKDAIDLLEPQGQLIVIGTRWVEGDFYSWLMDKDNEVSKSFDVMIKKAYEGDLETGDNFTSLWPAKFTQKELLTRLREKGWYEFCTPFETPILMSDFKVKPIGTIKEGDEVIGFELADGGRRKLVKTKVKKVSHLVAPIYNLKMKSGRTVRCTKEHKWYTGRGETDKTHSVYSPAKVGTKLRFVCPTYVEPKYQADYLAWHYLAGVFDGEGSTKSGGCLTITQGHIGNKVVYDKIIQTLNQLGIEYNEFERPAGNSHGRNSQANKMIWLKDNFETQLKFIRFTDLGKKEQIIDRLLKHGKRFVKELDEVLSIDLDREGDVYALETGTGNYIAWGYASSNSAQYMNNPVPEEDATFKKAWFSYFDMEEFKGKEMKTFITIDPAISLEKRADYTAMVVTGIDSFGNIFVKDIIRGHFQPSEIIDNLFKLNELWHPQLIILETIAYQKALAYSLREEMNKRRRFLPIEEINTHDKSKPERIKGLQPLYMNKKIFHRKGLSMIPYLEEELLTFPRSRHDDLSDAFSMVLPFLVAPKPRTTRYKHSYLY